MALAARGLRETEAGPVPIDDACVIDAHRRQARRVNLAALVLAAIGTATALLVRR